MKKIFLASLSWLFSGIGHGQLIAVDQNEKSFFVSSVPTMTFLYPAPDAKATLIFLPGGLGHVGVKPTTPASSPFFTKYHFNVMLKRLSQTEASSGSFNVVIFDNPMTLAQANKYTYPSSRRAPDHLVRIDSVVNHYKTMLGKPIWLLGHSNGAASITEYYKKLQSNQQENTIAGLVYSAAIHGSTFNDKTNLPVLFLHHEVDGCEVTTLRESEKVFNKLMAQGNSKSELTLIKGGSAEAKDPCLSGFHMYFGAEKEAADAIDRFMLKHISSQ